MSKEVLTAETIAKLRERVRYGRDVSSNYLHGLSSDLLTALLDAVEKNEKKDMIP